MPSGPALNEFGPLPAALPTDSPLLQTLAPTTPSNQSTSSTASGDPSTDDLSVLDSDTDSSATASSFDEANSEASGSVEPARAAPDDADQRAFDDSDKRRSATHFAPFGLVGLSKAFPMAGPEKPLHLLSRTEVETELTQLGLQATNAENGIHYTKDGSGVFIHKEEAYRVKRLTPDCVTALRKTGKKSVARYAAAYKKLAKSQEIANLTATRDAIQELRTSGILACSSSARLSQNLERLEKACVGWAEARSTVARLLHQTKVRQTQIDELKKQLATLNDVLAKDKEAARAASAAEAKVSVKKKSLVLALAKETQQDLEQVQAMLHAV